MASGLRIEDAGPIIRELRQRAGLTLRKLSELIGWDKSRLSRYETNHTALSLSAIGQIANGLGQKREEIVVLVVCKVCLFTFPKTARLITGVIKELEDSLKL